jgi:predicted enzyme related to lactoylglutathione lyase
MDRAIAFYETVFGCTFIKERMGDTDMAMFPFFETEIGSSGALVYHPNHKPSEQGILIYFTAFSGDLDNELSKVESSGGEVLVPKTEITPEMGFFAIFKDTEGNRVAMHSRK